jgi:hypothetical protein
MIYITLISKETKRENLRVLGSLERQSHSRIVALLVPLGQKFGGVFKGIDRNTQITHSA